jgi:hypothetical protein
LQKSGPNPPPKTKVTPSESPANLHKKDATGSLLQKKSKLSEETPTRETFGKKGLKVPRDPESVPLVDSEADLNTIITAWETVMEVDE